MKKSFLILALLIISTNTALSQIQTDDKIPNLITKGSWLIEANTGFGNVLPANTGISFLSSNGRSIYNIGLEGGYFILDRLAVKLGLGYGKRSFGQPTGNESGEGAGGEGPEAGGDGGFGSLSGGILSYKLGMKYYLLDKFPLQIDFSGTNVTGGDYFLGLQGGYSIFLGEKKNISIEPGVRYNVSLNSPLPNQNVFQFNVGFALHF